MRLTRDENGDWVFPENTVREGDNVKHIETGEPIKVGPIIKMSKSKKNVVSPEDIAETYGADAARWFMLSDSPPERDVEWTDSGVAGAWKLVNRIWETIDAGAGLLENYDPSNPPVLSENDTALRKAAHGAIDGVTADIEGFRSTRQSPGYMNLSTRCAKLTKQILGRRGEALSILVRLIAPFTPHLAEESWARLHGKEAGFVCDAPWPEADPALLKKDLVVIGVQINGKRRAELQIGPDMDAKEIEALALADEAVKRHTDGKTIRKIIVVPGRIVNIVAN